MPLGSFYAARWAIESEPRARSRDGSLLVRHRRHQKCLEPQLPASPAEITRWIWLIRWIQATLGYQIHRISRIHRAIARRRHLRNHPRVSFPGSQPGYLAIESTIRL